MGKVILTMNMTCDGFFNLDWMGQRPFTPDQELIDDNIAHMSEASGAFVGYPFYCGMVTYWQSMENNPQSTESERAMARAVNASQRIVISRTEETLAGANAALLVVKRDQDLIEAVNKRKQSESATIAVIGGVRTARTFARLGLIDEYQLLIHPVAIGTGEPVWLTRADLSLVSAKTYPSGVMRVCYQPA